MKSYSVASCSNPGRKHHQHPVLLTLEMVAPGGGCKKREQQKGPHMWSIRAESSHLVGTLLSGVMAMLLNETLLGMDADTECSC